MSEMPVTLFLAVILSLSCVVVAAEAQDIHDSSYALSQAEAYLTGMRSVDYTFAFSEYEHPVRVRALGIQIRCDATMPSMNARGETVLSEFTSAYNGTLYQTKRQLAKTMECSRMPLDSALMSGPCWTPLESIYRWCRTRETTFSWQDLQNPLTWKAVRALAHPVCSSATLDIAGEAVECVVVTLTRSPQVTTRVYLGVTKDFLPVKYEVYDTSADVSGPVYTLSVDELMRVESPEKSQWIPIAISAVQERIQQTQKPGFDTSYRHTYSLVPDSIRINHDISRDVFTLDHGGMLNVFLDGDRVYLPDQDKTVELALPGAIATHPDTARRGRWTLLMIVLNGIVVSVILVAIALRRRSSG